MTGKIPTTSGPPDGLLPSVVNRLPRPYTVITTGNAEPGDVEVGPSNFETRFIGTSADDVVTSPVLQFTKRIRTY